VPNDEELKQSCNLGYARNCSRLPKERDCDAVRFSVLRDRDGQVSICYVAELNYLPEEHGNLHYEVGDARWRASHPNVRVQTLAEAFLKAYLSRREESKNSPASLSE
jgi:hypothetical protein